MKTTAFSVVALFAASTLAQSDSSSSALTPAPTPTATSRNQALSPGYELFSSWSAAAASITDEAIRNSALSGYTSGTEELASLATAQIDTTDSAQVNSWIDVESSLVGSAATRWIAATEAVATEAAGIGNASAGAATGNTSSGASATAAASATKSGSANSVMGMQVNGVVAAGLLAVAAVL